MFVKWKTIRALQVRKMLGKTFWEKWEVRDLPKLPDGVALLWSLNLFINNSGLHNSIVKTLDFTDKDISDHQKHEQAWEEEKDEMTAGQKVFNAM